MKLQTNDGISCDICCSHHKKVFKYYSCDFYYVELVEKRPTPTNQILNNPMVASLDVCAGCFEDFKKKTINNNKSPGFKCDLSGKNLKNDKEYYGCFVTEVTVDMDKQLLQTTPRFLDLLVSSEAYHELKRSSSKQQITNTWSTKEK
jgi:hypothetical protein